VDVLMHSVAAEYGQRAIGVIMTGMGRDGASGISKLHDIGGYIIAQDAETSVIYGMNREVINNGDAHEVRPVQEIAAALVRLSQEPGRAQ
jgi:two-component system chemotaxis response regulator CheB